MRAQASVGLLTAAFVLAFGHFPGLPTDSPERTRLTLLVLFGF